MIKIYGKQNCIYCTKAVELATIEHLDFEYIDVGDSKNKAELLEKKPNVRSVPQIWMNDEYIGGYNEFAAKIETK